MRSWPVAAAGSIFRRGLIIEGNGGGGIVGYGMINLDCRSIYFEENNSSVSKADIYLEYSIFINLTLCDGHFASAPYPSVTLVSDVGYVFISNCNWQGTVDLSGSYNIYQLNAAQTVLGSNMNNISTGKITTFSSGDTSPTVLDSLYNGKIFFTANATPTTITSFDDGYSGQEILVYVNDANTTFGFNYAGNLRGNNGSAYVAASGDVIMAANINGNWHCSVIEG